MHVETVQMENLFNYYCNESVWMRARDLFFECLEAV